MDERPDELHRDDPSRTPDHDDTRRRGARDDLADGDDRLADTVTPSAGSAAALDAAAPAPRGIASLASLLLLEVAVGAGLALLLALVVLFSSGVSEFIYVGF